MLRVSSSKRTHVAGVRSRDWTKEGVCVMVGPVRHLPSVAEGGWGDTIEPVNMLSEGREAITEDNMAKAAAGRRAPCRIAKRLK